MATYDPSPRDTIGRFALVIGIEGPAVILDNARNVKFDLKAEFLTVMMQIESAEDRPGTSTASRLRGPSVAVALGLTGEGRRYRIAVRTQDHTAATQEVVDRIRRRVRGECEVKYVGRIRPQTVWYRQRNRPLRVGGSVGHFQITAGTLGCFVRRARAGADDAWILSNNHVLANENRARKGDTILQPAVSDGGILDEHRVGSLSDYIRLRTTINEVDAALAEIDEGMEYQYNWIHRLGALLGVRTSTLEIGERVFKMGRTTGLTRGQVSAIEVDGLQVGYDLGDLVFDNQIEIESGGSRIFSRGGDSGSLIVDSANRAIGLLFAGNDRDVTYANPIVTVLNALQVKLLY